MSGGIAFLGGYRSTVEELLGLLQAQTRATFGPGRQKRGSKAIHPVLGSPRRWPPLPRRRAHVQPGAQTSWRLDLMVSRASS